jgi:hypothetical protein
MALIIIETTGGTVKRRPAELIAHQPMPVLLEAPDIVESIAASDRRSAGDRGRTGGIIVSPLSFEPDDLSGRLTANQEPT